MYNVYVHIFYYFSIYWSDASLRLDCELWTEPSSISYVVHESREGSGKTVRIRWPVWTLVAAVCNTHHIVNKTDTLFNGNYYMYFNQMMAICISCAFRYEEKLF